MAKINDFYVGGTMVSPKATPKPEIIAPVSTPKPGPKAASPANQATLDQALALKNKLEAQLAAAEESQANAKTAATKAASEARLEAIRNERILTQSGANPDNPAPTTSPGVGMKWANYGGTWKQYALQPGDPGYVAPSGMGGSAGGNAGGASGDVIPTETGPTLAVDTFRKTIALFFGEKESKQPWVDSLYKTASGFRKTGSTADESMNLALQAARNDPVMKPFTDRFSAIYKLQDLKVAGAAVEVPTIAEFVNSQNALGDIFRRSNLGDLATDEYTSELLGRGLSVSTITENITKIFDVIDQFPKEIKDTINRYYPTADRGKLAKALLTGSKGIAQLDKEIKGYQVLAAAETQGIGANTITGGITAEQASNYAAGGATFQSSLAGFSQVALAREREQALATISGKTSMGVAGLSDAVIGKKASAISELEKLTSEEENRYKGRSSGILASQTRGMI